MTDKNKTAPGRVGRQMTGAQIGATENTNTSIIPQLSKMFDTDITLIKLYGYSSSNKVKDESQRYDKAKKATTPGWNDPDFVGTTEEEAQTWIRRGGWLGLKVPNGYEVVDIDDKEIGSRLFKALNAENIVFHAMETVNGYQFIFQVGGRKKTNSSKNLTACGALCDYRVHGKGYVVIPSESTPGRTWAKISSTKVDTTPVYFDPFPKNLNKEEKALPLPIKEGGRNTKIHSWLGLMVEAKVWAPDDIKRVAFLMGDHLCVPSYIKTNGSEALENTINSALEKKPSGNDYESEYNLQFTNSLDDLPNRIGPEKAQLPNGWLFEKNMLSLYQKGKTPTLVSHHPVIITGSYENLTDQTIGLVVAYLKNKKWRQVHKGRDYLMTHHKIVELSATGFPVSSINARKLVNYLQDYEARNMNVLPLYKVSEQLGFVEDGFLIGKTFINQDGKETDGMEEGTVTFSGADSGDEQFIEGFTTSGSLEGWLEAIERVKGYPRVLAGVFASFASVLAPIVKSSVFIYELAGETSKGKTIALRTFASVWGNPDEVEGGIIRKWNTTPVNLERMAGIVNHLPLFLDDTKEANEKNVAQAIYQLASGQGKGRGSTKGTQRTKGWRNVIFSTGEQKITSFSKDGGTAGRTLSILGMPFHEANHQTYQLVNELDMAVKENYGHAGRHFIKEVLKSRKDWPQWRESWLAYRNHFAAQVTDINSVAGRLAAYMALIALAGEFFCKVFKRKWNVEGMLQQLWADMVRDNTEADRPLEALKQIYDHIRSNKAYFQHDVASDHIGYFYGEWENPNGQWKEIRMVPLEVERALQALGYEPKAMLKSWSDRGWLVTTKGRGFRKQVKRKGTPVDYIVFKREALEQ